jgi:hypothetical protein
MEKHDKHGLREFQLCISASTDNNPESIYIDGFPTLDGKDSTSLIIFLCCLFNSSRFFPRLPGRKAYLQREMFVVG